MDDQEKQTAQGIPSRKSSSIPKREKYEDAGPITDEDEGIYGRIWDSPEIQAQIAKERTEREALEAAPEKGNAEAHMEDARMSDEDRRRRASRFVWQEGDVIYTPPGADADDLEKEKGNTRLTTTQKPVWVRTYGSDAAFKGQELLTRLGYIGIGWPEGGDFTGLDTQEKIRVVLEQNGKRARYNKHNRDAGIIHRFVSVAQIGDVVITRNHGDGRIYVGTIIGPYLYDTTQDKHFHSLRKVEWSYDMLPGIFSAEARHLIDTSGTFWQMQGDPSEFLRFYRPPASLQG